MLALGAFFIVAMIMAAAANLAATRVVKKRGIDEDGIAGKLTLSFLLGLPVVWMEYFPLPIGMLIFFIINPQQNASLKRSFALSGMVLSLISGIFGFIF
ncbi:hypothetical protein [Alkalicoccus luteus]|uniref:hypothetical protein n=1 Tax=Alkalicoccus luteus TaxID=1237094 RepID=UPI004033B852